MPPATSSNPESASRAACPYRYPSPSYAAVEFDDESCGLDILPLFNRFLTALERVMLHQLHAVRVIYQRIARNTRFGLIGFGETAVNYQ